MKRSALAAILILPALLLHAVYDPAEMTVNFDIRQNDPGIFEIGFSSTPEGRERLETIEMVVAEDDSPDVYAYWDVLSTSSFMLSLYCDPLISDSGERLDWSVSWTGDDAQTLSIGGNDEYGMENSDLIMTRSAIEGGSLAAKGSRRLDISVYNDGTQRAGDYSGTLVLKMESL